MAQKTEIAIFGGGCFWCTEAIFKMLKGVVSVMPGYAGGPSPSLSAVSSGLNRSGRAPSYEEVRSGTTGHAEVTRIEYDPEKISFRDLLTVFFVTHDPTTPERQGNDVGPQYRSIILTTSRSQQEEAERFIKEIDASHPGGAPVITEVKPLDKFYEAEEEHRDYYKKNPQKSYCQLIINPKLEKVQGKFEELLKNNEK
ncbi:MAG: peptide-methionine (S)-S-oxide reductase MsrA [Candidatus Sungiibacteriota bacterium]